MKELLLQSLVYLSPVVLAFIAWLAKKSVDLISANVHNARVKGILIRLDYAVFDVVQAVEQIYGDGKLTSEQKKAKAMELLKSYIGLKGLGELTKILGIGAGDVEGVLSTKVEATVNALTSQPQSAPKA